MAENEIKVLDNEKAFDLTENKQVINFITYDVLDLEQCDISYCKKVSFKENAEVNLGGTEALSQELDVSRCKAVDLSGRDLSTLSKPIVMKEGSAFDYNSELQSGMGINNTPPLTNVDFSRATKVSITGNDLCNYPELKFAPNADINLAYTQNIPANTDFSQCQIVNLSHCDLSNQPNLRFKKDAEVTLSNCTNYPANLDLSQCNSVTIRDTDLSQLQNIKFKDGAVVDLSGCTNIPSDIDFSNCRAVILSNTDLSAIKDLKLKDGAFLDLSHCKALPQKVDFDKCAHINLANTDLIFRTDVRFKDCAEVNLEKAQNIPDEVDFSPCAKINLRSCDLSSNYIDGTRTLTFRDGAEVSLQQCTNLPKNIDFTPCQKLNLSVCDLSDQTTLTLKENAHVAIKGASNIPTTNNLNQCQEIWLGANQVKQLDLGDAHIVLSGLGPNKVDISKLKSVTTGQVYDATLGNNTMTLLGTKEFIFKNRTQYQEYLDNPDNISIPKDVTIIFADEQKKELAQALSHQEGNAPRTKADAQNYRIDKATERHTQNAVQKTKETSQNSASSPIIQQTR